MKFGHTTQNLELIDWHLPQDPPQTQQWLSALPMSKAPAGIYIGCSVFTDPSFVGTIYPSKTKPSHFFQHYVHQFNALELNSTFYGIPAFKTVEQWKTKATQGFLCCPKFPRIISHQKILYQNFSMVEKFLSSILPLEEHLGMSFLQLPPFFRPENFSALTKFIKYMPRDFIWAVEVRHTDWFQKKYKHLLWDTLQQNNVAWVITDTNSRRDVLHQLLTTDTVFIRFKGNDLHVSDFFRLDQWVDTIIRWTTQGIRKVYFFLHTAQKHCCLALADYLIQKFLLKNPNLCLKRPIKYVAWEQTSFL